MHTFPPSIHRLPLKVDGAIGFFKKSLTFTKIPTEIQTMKFKYLSFHHPGLSSLGVPGVPWHLQILADQLTLSQLGGKDYTHHITIGTPRFSDLPMALSSPTLLSDICMDENKTNLLYIFICL
jgi:hypothetical protein